MRHAHYQKRAKQRGINESLIPLIINYGKRSPRPGGAEAIMLGGKGVDHAIRDIKKILQEVTKLRKVEVVLSREGEIITLYHRTKRAI